MDVSLFSKKKKNFRTPCKDKRSTQFEKKKKKKEKKTKSKPKKKRRQERSAATIMSGSLGWEWLPARTRKRPDVYNVTEWTKRKRRSDIEPPMDNAPFDIDSSRKRMSSTIVYPRNVVSSIEPPISRFCASDDIGQHAGLLALSAALRLDQERMSASEHTAFCAERSAHFIESNTRVIEPLVSTPASTPVSSHGHGTKCDRPPKKTTLLGAGSPIDAPDMLSKLKRHKTSGVSKRCVQKRTVCSGGDGDDGNTEKKGRPRKCLPQEKKKTVKEIRKEKRAAVRPYTPEEKKRAIERFMVRRARRLSNAATTLRYAVRSEFAKQRPRVAGRFIHKDRNSPIPVTLPKPPKSFSSSSGTTSKHFSDAPSLSTFTSTSPSLSALLLPTSTALQSPLSRFRSSPSAFTHA
jgi:hypothetical protein